MLDHKQRVQSKAINWIFFYYKIQNTIFRKYRAVNSYGYRFRNLRWLADPIRSNQVLTKHKLYPNIFACTEIFAKNDTVA